MEIAQQFTAGGAYSIQNGQSPVGTIEMFANPVGVAFSRPYGTAHGGRYTSPSDESLGYFHAVPTGHFFNLRGRAIGLPTGVTGDQPGGGGKSLVAP